MILRIVTILIIGLFVVPCVISEDLTDGQKARSVLSPEAASDVVNKAPPASPLEQRGSLQENVVEFVEEPMEMMDESLNTTTIIIPTSATVITTDDTTTTEETTTATTESTTTTTTTTTATTESTTTTETTESTTTTTTTTTATTESTTTTTTTATTESTTTTTTTATTESTTTTTTTATTELTTTTTTSPGVSSESTTDTSAITTTTTARTSTALPLETLVNCDFSTNCFGGGAFTPTNGSEFVSDPLLSTSDPPRAPTSDASSINKPTLGNGKPCRLPYKPSLSAGNPGATSWNISFCYNGQCPTGDGETSQCEPGNYGLLSLDPTESKLTVVDPLKRSAPAPRDTEGEQCLRFYYYFTVYDGQDWGQQIALSLIRASTGFVDEIVRLTIADMQENKWYFKGTTIDRRTDADMLQVVFTTNENRNETAETNRTINFAMDSIQLFDYNCTYVEEIVDGVVRPTQTRPPLTQPPPKDDKPDLALILGLSLGIGIPVLLVVGVGTFMYLKKRKNDSANEDMEMSGETEDDAGGDDEFSF